MAGATSSLQPDPSRRRNHAGVTAVGPPAWLVGPVAAIAALAILGFDFALFASGGGLLMAAVAAFWVGAGVAALIDPTRQGRNAMIVAAAIAVCMAVYVGMVTSRPAPPGTSYGGPNVYPPEPGR